MDIPDDNVSGARHSGVVFRNMTVKGTRRNIRLQPTVGDILLGVPRAIKTLCTKSLTSTASESPPRELLSHFDGCVYPGEMLLVLGRPGSGCSTFLKAFCNQREGFVAVEGDIKYGGVDAKTMKDNFSGETLYCPEADLHYASLSVKQTLMFALQTRTPYKSLGLHRGSRADRQRHFLRGVSDTVGLKHILGSKIGDQFTRGISGGEKKRVSIAEAMTTHASVQGWDNSSSGLDAKTALEYVNALRTLTNVYQTSTAVSLHQAGDALYELFDKVLLIQDGKCLYFGPAGSAKQYFLDLGFDCGQRRTTADFLTSITDPRERLVRKGWENRAPRNADEFALAYRHSIAFERNIIDIRTLETSISNGPKASPGAQSHEKTNYAVPFYRQVLACAHHQHLVLLGDRASLIGTWAGIVFQALIVGSMFYHLPKTTAGAFPRGGASFFVLLFNSLLALAEMTATFVSKPILLKHKSFSFYRPAAYVLGQLLVDLPVVAVYVLLFNTIVYWMAGLAASASQFLISCLTIWLVTLVTYAFFRAIAALCPTLNDATRVTGISIQILVIYTGYMIPPAETRVWFGWLRRINWLHYGFECLMANEFAGLTMGCVPPQLVPGGPGLSHQHQSCTLPGNKPGRISVDGEQYIEHAFGYTRDHLWRNMGLLLAFFFLFTVSAAFATERMSRNAFTRSMTIYKRGRVPKTVGRAIVAADHEKASAGDEEATKHERQPLAEDAVEDIGMGRDSSTGAKSETDGLPPTASEQTVYTFREVNYVIPFGKGERKLLQSVQGYVRPGKLTALMGVSGAGKTTLLNVLARRLSTGTLSGHFRVNGCPLPKTFERAAGFAEQMDVHEPTSTVREALRFSALLRQPDSVPIEDKYAYCEAVMKLLEIQHLAGAVVGRVGEGLNEEQRKRLTIGVELVSRPELVLFLDEPTTGLDSGAAFNVIRLLRKLADLGHTILCTIHQPSASLFEQLDDLILLKTGGRVVYHGPLGQNAQELTDYFAGNGALMCPADANPAEYMLEVIGKNDDTGDGKDWAQLWEQSKNYQYQSQQLADMNERTGRNETINVVGNDREYAMPLRVQVWAVALRSFTAYWVSPRSLRTLWELKTDVIQRSPDYIMGKIMLHVTTGLFLGLSFYHLGHAVIDMQLRLFAVFMVITISPPLIQQLQPVFLQSRNIFGSREHKAKAYS
jgi:ATP-binding cassette, subfamily G (WHITE), member 2, SNQ2